ncbi:hypothetical protein [Nonomuraea fuscirosea]|uniref:hypothetical protein n=1 Tax=Nonomuraea fuscirosea TaxID=1291556 RepID=UPI0034160027
MKTTILITMFRRSSIGPAVSCARPAGGSMGLPYLPFLTEAPLMLGLGVVLGFFIDGLQHASRLKGVPAGCYETVSA